MTAERDPVGEVVRDVLADAWRRGDTAGVQAATFARARDLGWHLLGVAEAAGGVGGTLADRVRLAGLLGEHAADGPYLEVNTAVAHLHGLDGVDRGALADGRVAVVDADDFAAPPGRSYLDDVGEVDHVLVVGAGQVRTARGAPPEVAATGGGALLALEAAGEPLPVDQTRVAEVRADLDRLRCARLVGAMRAAAASSARHGVEREQFGRPLYRFQALAALIAEQRAAVELADAALQGALAAPPSTRRPLLDSAVWVATDAAGTVARLAHQVHGAMGTTHEHHLHRLTRRLWTWRDQLGAGRARATRLGAWAARVGEPAMWDGLAPGVESVEDA